MMNAIFGTVDVVQAPAPAARIGPFYTAPDGVPMRVLVRNVGGSEIFLALLPAAITGNIGTAVFRLPAGTSESFPIAGRQSMYAVSSGAGGRISWAASEALPFGVVPASLSVRGT